MDRCDFGGIGHDDVSSSSVLNHHDSATPQEVTLRQMHRSGSTATESSSNSSRRRASSSVSPGSIPPPGKQYLPGAAIPAARRITQKPSFTDDDRDHTVSEDRGLSFCVGGRHDTIVSRKLFLVEGLAVRTRPLETPRE